VPKGDEKRDNQKLLFFTTFDVYFKGFFHFFFRKSNNGNLKKLNILAKFKNND